MTFDSIRKHEIDGEMWYCLEDTSRWLRIQHGKARGLLKRYQGTTRIMPLKLDRWREIRTTWVTGGGVVVIAAEYSRMPNHLVRSLVGAIDPTSWGKATAKQ